MLIEVTHTKVSAKSDGSDPDLVQPSDWNDPHTVSVTLEDEVTIITANTTITVGSSGADFTTIAAALQSLRSKTISDAAVVTLSLAAETFNEAISIEHQDAKRIALAGVGENISITGISSSSGAAGNWTYTFTVSSVGNAAAGHYLLVGSASGGVTPNRVVGALKIVSVGVGEIVATSLSRHAAAASGAVTATARLVRTVLTSPGPVMSIAGRTLGRSTDTGQRALNDVIFESVTSGAAVSVSTGGSIISDCTNVGIVNTSTGAALSVDNCCASLPNVVCSGGAYPIYIDNSGQVVLTGATVCGGSTASIYNLRRGYANLTSARLAGGVTGLYASAGGYNYAVGLTFNDYVTTAASPAVNTVGNDNAYNDT